MADMSNFYTAMMQPGLGLFGQNPYSQFNNPGQVVGWPTQYVGWPTNAMGAPIQAPPGTTINQTSQPSAPQQQANPNQQAFDTALLNSMGRNLVPQGFGGGPSAGGRGSAGEGSIAGPQLNDIVDMRAMLGPNPNAVQTGNAGNAGQSNAGGLAGSQYLSLLANPGRTATPGATGAANRPSVLQQFLASRGGETGAGGYTNVPFFNTLNRLQGQRNG